ncbi:MAG TPA: M23 family metallopeptidase [Polyangia bacterium]|jgi:murein DD-endopeptidase MepM/ murein hydrolase activator NlpD|nr:M23 family metallopeptidase [Polyangia bacterium]
MAESCFVCGNAADENDRLVLVHSKRREIYCSSVCLRHIVRKQRAARTAAQLRWTLRVSLSVLALIGVGTLWQRHRTPRPQSISYPWPEVLGDAAPAAGASSFGPPWPPTDEQWMALFNTASWVYPLPGPNRRSPTIDGQMLGLVDPREPPARCRKDDQCGVNLGGELWGEHVYAAQDGVVERVREGGHDQPGGIYVRLSHSGGTVFTQYFHLAGTPRGLVRGARVRAGDVIGLVGDTGLEGGHPHLHFTLSVRPSKGFAEVYWDPTPWMARSQLRVPPHGSVAGLISEKERTELPRPPR